MGMFSSMNMVDTLRGICTSNHQAAHLKYIHFGFFSPFPPIFYFFPIPITSVVSKTSQLCKMDLVRNFKLSFIKECADSQKKSLLFQRVSIWNPQMLVSQLLNVLICVKPKTHCRNPLRNVFLG